MKDKLQSLYVGLILLSISLYGIMLLTALLASIEKPLADYNWGSLQIGDAVKMEVETIRHILHQYSGAAQVHASVQDAFSWIGNV